MKVALASLPDYMYIGGSDTAHTYLYIMLNTHLLAGPRMEDSTALDLKCNVSCAIIRWVCYTTSAIIVKVWQMCSTCMVMKGRDIIPLCANLCLILYSIGSCLKAMCDTDLQTVAHVCGAGPQPTIPLRTVPYMLCRHVRMVITEQSSVPSSIVFSLSEGGIIHGRFMIVSAWVAVRVT